MQKAAKTDKVVSEKWHHVLQFIVHIPLLSPAHLMPPLRADTDWRDMCSGVSCVQVYSQVVASTQLSKYSDNESENQS